MVLAHCSLHSMRSVEGVGARKFGRTRGRHAPVLSCTHYFQSPATQANCQCEFVRNI